LEEETTDAMCHSLSILLIHHRMQDHLRACLESIAACRLERCRTIVAHLATPEDSGQWIVEAFPWVRLVKCDRFGIAWMRNRALEAAGDKGDVLVLDVDARLRPGAVEALAAFLAEHPRCAAVGPRTLHPDGSLERNAKRFYTWATVLVRRSPLNRLWPNNFWTRRHLMQDRDWGKAFACDWIAGAGMLLRAEAVRQIGGFDERFRFGFEDVDWCFRARMMGWEVWYCPEAVIEHHVQRKSARGLNPFTIEHLKSLWRFWRKHGRLNLPSLQKVRMKRERNDGKSNRGQDGV